MTKIIFDKLNEIYNTKGVDEKSHIREYINKISRQIISEYQLHPTDQFYENIIKIYDKMRIEKLWEEVIATSANKINDMFPIWDEVAKNAFSSMTFPSYNRYFPLTARLIVDS